MKFPWSKAEEPANPAEPTEADKKHWEEEYEKNRHQQSEPKKPGVFGSIARKAGGAAVGYAKDQVEKRRETKAAEAQYYRSVAERPASHNLSFEDEQKIYEKSGQSGVTEAQEGAKNAASYSIGNRPPKIQKQYERTMAQSGARELQVQSEAKRQGINLYKIEKKVESVRDRFGGITQVARDAEVPKTVPELEAEINKARTQRRGFTDARRSQQRADVLAPLTATGQALGKGADVMDRMAKQPNLRPMGGSRGVTPTGIRGGNQLFAPSFRSGGTGPNMQAGMRMHTGAGLGQLRTGMSVPRPQQRARPQMANRPLPITGRPMSPATRVPSVMPRMNLSAAPRLNYGAGGSLRRPTVPKMNIGRGMGLNLNRNPGRNASSPGSVPKLRLF